MSLIKHPTTILFLYKIKHFQIDDCPLEFGNGTAINGMFKTDNSAKVEAPALVIQRSELLIISSKFLLKLKI